jgi:hypothetical protein
MYTLRGVCVTKYTAAQLLYNSLDRLSSLESQIPTPTTTHQSSVTSNTHVKEMGYYIAELAEATTNKNWIT